MLLLPDDHSDYVRGRRRQALRTNLTRAASAGISCEVVEDRSRALDETFEIERQRTHTGAVDAWQTALAPPEVTVVVARNERGDPLACAAVVIDEVVCLIVLTSAISHEARWALHDYLVRILIAQRVRYLIASGGGLFGALGYAANVQHYQHLLGYELRHVSAQSLALRPVRRPLRILRRRETSVTR
jgi:hypothetical protein